MTEQVKVSLSLEQTRVLVLAVEVCLKLDGAALLDQEARQMAEEAVRGREGAAGVAQIDQALASARARYPILSDLRTALYDHVAALERRHLD